MSAVNARLRYVQARHEIARLERELSGCDWCCGGGSARLRYVQAQMRRAASELRALGESLPRPLCRDCGYYDAADGDRCSQCRNYKGVDQ